MITAADGTAFTGSVTVAVTVDAGTQATGSVGSGACVHEGNGYHTYAPAQAETNGDLVACTFTGTGAVPVTVQVYTVAGDAFTRLGAPAGASVSADIAAVKVDTAAVLVDTGTTLDGRIPAALVSGRMDASVGAMASGVLTATAIAADAITDAKVASDVTIASVTGAVGSVTGAVGSVTGNVGGNVTGSIGSVASGGITAASIAAAAFTSAKFHADTGLVPIRSSTATAGAADTITLDASASETNDFYNNCLLVIISGTGAGQARFISDYVGATKVASVRTWVTNPDNTSVFVILGSDATSAGLVADAVLDEPLLDSVPADGSLPTLRQALYMICQYLMERSVSGTTVTIRKVDGSTTLMQLTLNDGTNPTSITRTT